MTVKEGFNKFTKEVEDVFHDVEEVLHDVKEHMILSVRDYSIQIAFVLMGITSAILVIGTVYVWCFHHPKQSKSSKKSDNNEQVSEHPSSEQSALPNEKRSENSASSIKQRTNENEAKLKADDTHREVFEEDAQAKDGDVVPDQNGLRQRTTTANANNNNSPVKSKIPVRQKSRNSSSS